MPHFLGNIFDIHKTPAILIIVLLQTIMYSSAAFATNGDVYAKDTIYCALTYEGHPSNPEVGGIPVDLNVGTGWDDDGLPLYAPENGSVTIITYDNGLGTGWGNSIIWTNGDETLYLAHLKNFGETGQVNSGEIIGYVGNTGASKWPHLHIQSNKGQLTLSGNLIQPDIYPKCKTQLPSSGPVSYGASFYRQDPVGDLIFPANSTQTFILSYTNSGSDDWKNTGGVVNPKYVELRSVSNTGASEVDCELYPGSGPQPLWINSQRLVSPNAANVGPGENGWFIFSAKMPASTDGTFKKYYFRPYHAAAGFIGETRYFNIKVTNVLDRPKVMPWIPLLLLDNVVLKCPEYFVSQPTYGTCDNRPPGSVCIGYNDGYTWLVYDSIVGWGSNDNTQIAYGLQSEYHHILNSDCIKLVDNSTNKPDLIVSSVQPGPYWYDYFLEYTYTIKNIGNASADLDGISVDHIDNVVIQTFLSKDEVYDSGIDIAAGGKILGHDPLPILNPGESLSGHWYYSFTFNPSEYPYLLVWIDYQNDMDESNEDNNISAFPVINIINPNANHK